MNEETTATAQAQQPLDHTAPRDAKASYKSVYLGWTSYEALISIEAYEQLLLPLVRQYSICKKCRQYYHRQDNPNVAGNLCLCCFLRDHSGLTFHGLLDMAMVQGRYISPNEPYELHREYLFLDQRGYVHTTQAGPGKNETAQEDRRATARYWHFPLPEEATKNGKTVMLRGCTCHLYGNVQSSQVIIATFAEYSPDINVAFIVRKNGPAIQINKRLEMHRRLLAEARAELEATKQPNGYYRLADKEEEQAIIWPHDIYTLIARKINAELAEPEADEAAQH